MILEGLVYALAPSLLERMLELLRELPPEAIRQIGALVVVVKAFVSDTGKILYTFEKHATGAMPTK